MLQTCKISFVILCSLQATPALTAVMCAAPSGCTALPLLLVAAASGYAAFQAATPFAH